MPRKSIANLTPAASCFAYLLQHCAMPHTLRGRPSAVFHPQQHGSLLQTAERLTAFVKKQNKRDIEQDVKKEWLLCATSLRTTGLQTEQELLRQAGEAANVVGGKLQESCTQLSECKQDWGQLQAALLGKVQACKNQPASKAALAKVVQQKSILQAAAATLGQEADAVQGQLSSDWPSALTSPELNSMLAQLQGHVDRIASQHLLASSQVKEQVQVGADALHADFQKRHAQWQEASASHAQEKHAKAPASWSRQQQDMFALLCQPAVDEAAGVGMKGTRARISMLLPGVPDSAAIGAYDWQRRKKVLEQQNTTLVNAFLRAEEALLLQAQQLLQQSADQEQAQALAAAGRLEALIAQDGYHCELKVLRCEKFVTEALSAQQAELEQQAQLAKAEEQRREEELYRTELKHLLVAHHAEQAAAQMQEQKEALELIEQQRQEALVKYEHNEQRTSFRQEVSRQKEALQQQRQWQLQQQESERERRLAELRAQVQVHAEVDPERVMAATVASSAQAADEEGAFAPIHGYTTDALLKDKRFKVLEALRQHSLQNSSYATQALLSVKPATMPRRDALTTVEKAL